MTSPRIAAAELWHRDRPRRCRGLTVFTLLWLRFPPRRCTRWATHAVLVACGAGHTAWTVTCGLCLADAAPVGCRTCGATANRIATVAIGEEEDSCPA